MKWFMMEKTFDDANVYCASLAPGSTLAPIKSQSQNDVFLNIR